MPLSNALGNKPNAEPLFTITPVISLVGLSETQIREYIRRGVCAPRRTEGSKIALFTLGDVIALCAEKVRRASRQ